MVKMWRQTKSAGTQIWCTLSYLVRPESCRRITAPDKTGRNSARRFRQGLQWDYVCLRNAMLQWAKNAFQAQNHSFPPPACRHVRNHFWHKDRCNGFSIALLNSTASPDTNYQTATPRASKVSFAAAALAAPCWDAMPTPLTSPLTVKRGHLISLVPDTRTADGLLLQVTFHCIDWPRPDCSGTQLRVCKVPCAWRSGKATSTMRGNNVN